MTCTRYSRRAPRTFWITSLWVSRCCLAFAEKNVSSRNSICEGAPAESTRTESKSLDVKKGNTLWFADKLSYSILRIRYYDAFALKTKKRMRIDRTVVKGICKLFVRMKKEYEFNISNLSINIIRGCCEIYGVARIHIAIVRQGKRFGVTQRLLILRERHFFFFIKSFRTFKPDGYIKRNISIQK